MPSHALRQRWRRRTRTLKQLLHLLATASYWRMQRGVGKSLMVVVADKAETTKSQDGQDKS